jgi:hypothetical protein
MTDLNGGYYSDSEQNFLNSEWLSMNSEVWLAIGHLSGTFLGIEKSDSLVMNLTSLCIKSAIFGEEAAKKSI